jgi:hypothetical protein
LHPALQAGPHGLRAALASGILLCALLAPCAWGGAETSSPRFVAAFENCIASLPPDEADDEYEYEFEYEDEPPPPPSKLTLADLCHDVHATIAASDLAPFLPEDWANRATPDRVRQWRELLEPPVVVAGRRPDPAAVAGILAGIETEQQVRERTLWQRFRDWLKQLLDRRVSASESSWIGEWLREHAPSERAVRWITAGLGLLLVAALFWIVYVELRAAGLLRRPGSLRAARERGARAAELERRGPTLADATDEQLPGLLIALLLEQLRRLGWMQDRQSMTHRELARAAHFEAAGDGETFQALVTASERLRYAATAPAATTLRGIVDQARRLLESMSRLPRSAA